MPTYSVNTGSNSSLQQWYQQRDIPDHLRSTTCFGDNIEDEWFIVYIVLEVSKMFKELVIQMRDSDGDFILIEAADCLPTWANPNTTGNRVFIHNGDIHLISPEIWELKDDIKIKQAIKLVTDPNVLTIASDKIKEIIHKRVQMYPDKLEEMFHKAIVSLPIDIAAILKIKPSLISYLVNMYCSHDILDKRVCKSTKCEDFVLTEVKFTKCLYAMLHHAKPIKLTKNAAVNFNEVSLGMKLTSAYYMIMNENTSDIFSTKRFKKFLQKLQSLGYFKENLEGSVYYKKLLENAKEFYVSTECPLNSVIGYEIREITTSKEFIELKSKLRNIDQNAELIGDTDDWLKISPEQLDDFLTSRYGKQLKFKKDNIVTAETVTSELSQFLKQTSDFEGVETYQDMEDIEIDFDPDKFQDSIETMLNLLSSKTCDMQISGSENSDNESTVSEDQMIESEIKSKLLNNLENSDKSKILQNIIQSTKEEQLTGPSSNILKTIGISKATLLDSDDYDSDDDDNTK